MWIGSGMFLLIVGAIFRYAVTARVQGISFTTIGTILMIGGGIFLVLGIVRMIVRRRGRGYTETQRATFDPQTGTATQSTDIEPH